jgi:hypothetical protein
MPSTAGRPEKWPLQQPSGPTCFRHPVFDEVGEDRQRDEERQIQEDIQPIRMLEESIL